MKATKHNWREFCKEPPLTTEEHREWREMARGVFRGTIREESRHIPHTDRGRKVNLTTRVTLALEFEWASKNLARLADRFRRIATILREMEKQEEVCSWKEDSREDYWIPGCGGAFCFADGGPGDNSMKFCPFCGKRLEQLVDTPCDSCALADGCVVQPFTPECTELQEQSTNAKE